MLEETVTRHDHACVGHLPFRGMHGIWAEYDADRIKGCIVNKGLYPARKEGAQLEIKRLSSARHDQLSHDVLKNTQQSSHRCRSKSYLDVLPFSNVYAVFADSKRAWRRFHLLRLLLLHCLLELSLGNKLQ